jgi:transglutaminase-like putative cysteine protease
MRSRLRGLNYSGRLGGPFGTVDNAIENGVCDHVFNISDGVEGVRETVYLMSRIVRRDRRNPVVIELARALTRNLPEKDWWREAEAIFRYVRDQIRYVQDPEGVETLTDSERLIEIGAGDCDDKAILLASLLSAINHPTRFVIVGERWNVPEHVYVETKIGNRWIAMDPTMRHEMGWFPPELLRIFHHHN